MAGSRTALLLTMLALLGAGTPGCVRTTIDSPLSTVHAPGDWDAELDFWHELPGRRVVSNDEALYGLMLLAGEEKIPEGYGDRVLLAKERAWLGSGWDEPADVAAQRGTISRALVVILDIRGGVIMQTFGPSGRYGQKELVFVGIMPESTENQVISGRDFLGVISRAQDHMMARAMRAAREAPAQPESEAEAAPAQGEDAS